jgi:hypothetical protein
VIPLQEFYIILNVAVGGTGGYFPDGVDGKPWTDTDPHAVNSFWNAEKTWYPTWQKVRFACCDPSAVVARLSSEPRGFLVVNAGIFRHASGLRACVPVSAVRAFQNTLDY